MRVKTNEQGGVWRVRTLLCVCVVCSSSQTKTRRLRWGGEEGREVKAVRVTLHRGEGPGGGVEATLGDLGVESWQEFKVWVTLALRKLIKPRELRARAEIPLSVWWVFRGGKKRMCTMRETLTASRCATEPLQLCLIQVFYMCTKSLKTTTCCVQTWFVLIGLHLQHLVSTQTPASHDEGYIRRQKCPTSRCECYTTSQTSQGWSLVKGLRLLRKNLVVYLWIFASNVKLLNSRNSWWLLCSNKRTSKASFQCFLLKLCLNWFFSRFIITNLIFFSLVSITQHKCASLVSVSSRPRRRVFGFHFTVWLRQQTCMCHSLCPPCVMPLQASHMNVATDTEKHEIQKTKLWIYWIYLLARVGKGNSEDGAIGL